MLKNVETKFGRSRVVAAIFAVLFLLGIGAAVVFKVDNTAWIVLWLAYGFCALLRFLYVTRRRPGTHHTKAVWRLKNLPQVLPEVVLSIALLFFTGDGFKFQTDDVVPVLVALGATALGLVERKELP